MEKNIQRGYLCLMAVFCIGLVLASVPAARAQEQPPKDNEERTIRVRSNIAEEELRINGESVRYGITESVPVRTGEWLLVRYGSKFNRGIFYRVRPETEELVFTRDRKANIVRVNGIPYSIFFTGMNPSLEDRLTEQEQKHLQHVQFDPALPAGQIKKVQEQLSPSSVSFRGAWGISSSQLSALSGLSVLDLSRSNITDRELKTVAGFEKLSVLDLEDNYKISDEGLRHLSGLQNLSTLDLKNTGITGEGLEHLSDLNSLYKLNLGKTETTDKAIKHLSGLKKLSVLDISNTKITAKGLKSLSDLKNLFVLDLGFTKITDDSLKHMANLRNLSSLDLSNTKITDKGLKHLSDLKNLFRLNLRATQITDKGLKKLSNLASLNRLNLSFTRITDKGLKYLTGLRNLSVIDLSNTKITDNGLKHLSGLRNLSRLYLQETKITDKGLKNLSNLTSLNRINLASTSVADKGLKHLSGLRKLTALDLSVTQITDGGLKQLSDLLNLSVLHLRRTQITDESLNHLSKLQELYVLDLRQTEVTPHGLINHPDLVSSLHRIRWYWTLVFEGVSQVRRWVQWVQHHGDHDLVQEVPLFAYILNLKERFDSHLGKSSVVKLLLTRETVRPILKLAAMSVPVRFRGAGESFKKHKKWIQKQKTMIRNSITDKQWSSLYEEAVRAIQKQDDNPGKPKEVEKWVKALGAKKFKRRKKARRELRKMEPTVITQLLPHRNDENAERRKQVNRLLQYHTIHFYKRRIERIDDEPGEEPDRNRKDN